MSYSYNKTKYSKLVRISPANLKKLKEMDKYRTLAGRLDMILNQYFNKQNEQNEQDTHEKKRKI